MAFLAGAEANQAFFLAAARNLDGFGRLLPLDPRRILPRLLLKSPLPMGIVLFYC